MSSVREMDKSGTYPWVQTSFSRGMIKNAPHCDIAPDALAYLRNAHAFATECQPRLGVYPWSQIQPPVLETRDACKVTRRENYTASKTGNIITATESIFTVDDVSNYFVWPGDPAFHDNIEEYISPKKVRVRDSGDREQSSNCWMHAKKNLWEFHFSQKKVIFQWGTDIYIADNIELTSWTKALCVSKDGLSNAISEWDELDDYGVIFNSNGIFLLVLDDTQPILFKKNTPVPTVIIEQNVQTALNIYRYDYTYSMSRLSGNRLRSRTMPNIKILQESGTCAFDETLETPADYGTTWKPKKIDSGLKTHGKIIGGTVDNGDLDPAVWAIADASFGVTINGNLEYFELNLAEDSLSEMASEIQDALRFSFPGITFIYDSDNKCFIVTSGEENGSLIDWFVDGMTGTSIAGMLRLRAGDGGTLDNADVYASPSTVGLFNVPNNTTAVTEREWHWTHYTIYRTCDLGPYGFDPRATGGSLIINTETGMSEIRRNSPVDFTWVADLRVAAAFWARRDTNGHVFAMYGQFEEADVGSSLVWADGEVDTIYQYISEQEVTISIDYYETSAKAYQAAAIGGGEVLSASQSGNLVTANLTSDDIRKTIFWSDGTYNYITGCNGKGGFYVNDSITRPLQGITIDPTQRTFNDTVSDETLRNRQGELHVGLLAHRFWWPMPNINTGVIVPGFMIGAIRDSSLLYYCQLGVSTKYLSGYHLSSRQTNDRIESGIRVIKKMPNKFIVFCNNSTWGGPTNIATPAKLPKYYYPYTIAQIDIIDERLGVLDYPSIQAVDYGILEMRTSDGSWRQFNGYKFGEDLSVDPETGQDRVRKDLAECWDISESCYGETIGHIWWGRVKNADNS